MTSSWTEPNERGEQQHEFQYLNVILNGRRGEVKRSCSTFGKEEWEGRVDDLYGEYVMVED